MTLSAPLPLAAVLDTSAAGPLCLSLRQVIEGGAPLSIDGSAVERIGLACLQVLMAARATAAGAGISFTVDRPSAALTDMATLAGLGALVAA